ncbi:MAG: DUF1284 domain-containing protein [Bacillota bacterium]
MINTTHELPGAKVCSSRISSSMVKLRGHHLICLHFFKGEGYSRNFIDNLANVIEKAGRNGIEIVDGTDDVCGACPYNRDGFCTYSENADQGIRRLDELAVGLLHVGNAIGWEDLKRRIPGIIEVWKEEACMECDWKPTCFIA